LADLGHCHGLAGGAVAALGAFAKIVTAVHL
jgi:hypothetical protein